MAGSMAGHGARRVVVATAGTVASGTVSARHSAGALAHPASTAAVAASAATARRRFIHCGGVISQLQPALLDGFRRRQRQARLCIGVLDAAAGDVEERLVAFDADEAATH